ncbi:MAG: YbhN family protein [Actinomycetota bacterium]|nr:YbhN family protein [Actinomycetota bacterium]
MACRPDSRRWPASRSALAAVGFVWLRRYAGRAAFGWSLGSWGLDCACLLLSFVAVGAPVPWRGLLLAYGAGQLAATLPITPGGLGVVEGSLTIAIVAYGGGEISTVAARPGAWLPAHPTAAWGPRLGNSSVEGARWRERRQDETYAVGGHGSG